MLKTQRLLTLSALAAFTLASNAALSAETYDMKAGGSITTKFGVWNSSNCEAGAYPEITFKQPANGKITTRKGRGVEPAGSACAGKNLPGIFVTYTPNKGFRGQDCGSLSMAFPTYVGGTVMTSRRFDICINVK